MQGGEWMPMAGRVCLICGKQGWEVLLLLSGQSLFYSLQKTQAIEVFWQIFLMGLFQTVKYVQCEIFQLPFP